MTIIDIHPYVISTDTRRHPLMPLGGTQSTWSRDRPTPFEKLVTAMDAETGPADEVQARRRTEYVEVQKILADVKQTTGQLPGMAKTVGGEVQDASGVMLQTQSAIREAEKLIVGIQQHWLLRKYVDQVKPPERIPPQAVSAGSGGGK